MHATGQQAQDGRPGKMPGCSPKQQPTTTLHASTPLCRICLNPTCISCNAPLQQCVNCGSRKHQNVHRTCCLLFGTDCFATTVWVVRRREHTGISTRDIMILLGSAHHLHLGFATSYSSHGETGGTTGPARSGTASPERQSTKERQILQ
eukprot:TRINITY_DN34129_c0_g1_i1.p1 TRINITY_DN34129_c0_g1~~TRINITY_DN34129_c0_g1_i1.p1  ORF type:complete len:149 (-),score=5.97 TRINITY_DN34129_c0_g1_i1:63-509(-)